MVEVHPAVIQDVEHRPKLSISTEVEGIPVIDLSILNSPDTSTDAELASLVAEVRNACKKWGFFQVINHGVSLECREKLELASRKFFALSKEEKIKVKRNELNFMGYYNTELTKKIRDWKEVFDFTVEKTTVVPLSQDPDDKELRDFHNQWPEYPPELREVCEEYIQEVRKLSYKLAELISLSLGLPAKRLNEFFEDQIIFGRLNHYPPCPIPHLALGVGRHKDAGLFTILVQDDTGGLEIKRKTDGEWIGVKSTPHAYIVNLGDATQVYSNGEYESVEHRVVLNTERGRFSIPFFVNPSHSTWIQPLEEMVNDKNPPKYKAYNWGMLYTHRRGNDPKTRDNENLHVDHFKGSAATDAAVMQELKKRINPPSSLNWNDPEPCKWSKVQCTKDGRVTKIQVGDQGLKGSLPLNMNNLTKLQVFEVQRNALSGALPSFAGLNSLQSILLNSNGFTSIPSDFFYGMTNLQSVYLDINPFSPWSVPESLKSASSLQTLSAFSANIIGKIPDFFGGDTFSSLINLHLSFNNLEGSLPSSFSGSSIQSLWLNGHKGRLNGSIAVVQNMTRLTQLWLQGNEFTGLLPDFSGLTQLQDCNLRDNCFSGPVPDSLVNLPSLKVVNLTNNFFQGPTPKFPSSVRVDMLPDRNSFCLSKPGPCDSRVNSLLAVAKDLGYPTEFAENWKGNDPCSRWLGITCDGGNITVLNFQKRGLNGTISPNYSSITSLQKLILANNFLTGTIPNELTLLPNLKELDVSNNQLYGKIPPFKRSVVVKTEGNVNIGKDHPPPSAPGTV